MRSSDTVVDVLRRAALSRSVFPVWLPGHLLLPMTSLPRTLRRHRDELLAAIRRRVLYKRVAVSTQLLGLAASWVGAWVHVRPVTAAGLVFAAVGAALGLFSKDRLVSLDSRIEELGATHRTLLCEWLAMTLEIEPYSYARTGASGRDARDVLDERRSAIEAGVADALDEWLKSPGAQAPPSQWWSQLRADLLGLAMVDERGLADGRRLEVTFDLVHALLLLTVVAGAVAAVIFALPTVAIATVTTLIVLGGRAAHDVTLSVFPSQPKTRPTYAAQPTSWRRFCGRPVTELTPADLDTICDTFFLIPRAIRKKRTLAALEKEFAQ